MPNPWMKKLKSTKTTFREQFILTLKVCRISTPLIKTEKGATFAEGLWLSWSYHPSLTLHSTRKTMEISLPPCSYNMLLLSLPAEKIGTSNLVLNSLRIHTTQSRNMHLVSPSQSSIKMSCYRLILREYLDSLGATYSTVL